MKKIIFGLLAISLLGSCSIFKKNNTKESYKVLLQTTEGDITLQLYEDVPQHAKNFLKLVKDGFYDGVLFHRVIPQFMIQGGDPTSKTAAAGVPLGNGDIGYTIPAEFMVSKYVHKKGALCAARTSNPEKASSGCQFYIVEGKTLTDAELDQLETSKGFKYTPEQRKIYKEKGGTAFLDNEYTVYGEVLSGLDVVSKIANIKRAPSDRPVEDVRITKAKIIK